MPNFENVTSADDFINYVQNYFNPQEQEIFEPVNAITTIVRISPNITKMEAKVQEKYVPDG